jgi:DNA-binding NtrC family response regulator
MLLALIVDDDADLREALAGIARLEGFDTETAGSLAEARARLGQRLPAVILSDLVLPDGNGIELLQDLSGTPRPDVILVTGNATVDSAVSAIREGVLDYLIKPVDLPRLKAVLANVSRTRALKHEIQELRGELRKLGRFGRMWGNSEAMQRVYDMVARAAPTTAPVLIVGESGTGKELVAQTLHDLSPRKDGPFVAVNCSAVPATLIESELFGHEKGSFTGATQQHRGVFERASGGTLFLDEITEMPAELQARLLRVLETANLTRIGGEEPVSVRVRVVAATNRSPERAVEAGRLRADLYYRLNVFPIQLPPLRERGEDVVLLAQHFLDELNGEAETEKPLSATARERLRSHGWPGNVRELRNAIHRAYIMAKDEVELETVQGPKLAGPGGDSREESGEAPLQEIERREILARLEKFSGDKRRTAASLGISLKTLYNRLNVYGGRPATS